jgi:hypothetical protein
MVSIEPDERERLFPARAMATSIFLKHLSSETDRG